MIKRILNILTLVLIVNKGFSQNSYIKLVKKPDSKKVDVFIGDEHFTSLLYADSLKKVVLYPVNAAGNISVTRGWPINPKMGDQVDHPHQIGAWFNYGDVNGADYWNHSSKVDTNAKAYGTIKFEKILSGKSGNDKAELVTLSTWYNPKGKATLRNFHIHV